MKCNFLGLSSSIESLSQSETSIHEDRPELIPSSSSESGDYYNFYKPDMSTPPRFKNSKVLEEDSDISLPPLINVVEKTSNDSAGGKMI